MNTLLQFRLEMQPTTATSQGAGKRMTWVKGRPMFFKDKKAAQAQNDFAALLAPHRPPLPFDGPLEVEIVATWPWLAGDSKKLRESRKWIHKTTKPDADNMAKLLVDCMTRLGFWLDDSVIARFIAEKRRGEKFGYEISVRFLEEKKEKPEN